MLLACDSSIAVRDVARQKEGNDVQEKVGMLVVQKERNPRRFFKMPVMLP